MPSDTAFLGDLPAGNQLATSYDTLGGTMDSLSRQRTAGLQSHGISPRALMSTINNLQALGIYIDENNAVLKGLRAGIMTNYSLYLLYGAIRAYRKAEAAKEAALAAEEVSVLAVAQQWHLIAQGVAAAALVTGAFAVGEKFGSGDWNLPSVNIHNPADRRKAASRLADIRG